MLVATLALALAAPLRAQGDLLSLYLEVREEHSHTRGQQPFEAMLCELLEESPSGAARRVYSGILDEIRAITAASSPELERTFDEVIASLVTEGGLDLDDLREGVALPDVRDFVHRLGLDELLNDGEWTDDVRPASRQLARFLIVEGISRAFDIEEDETEGRILRIAAPFLDRFLGISDRIETGLVFLNERLAGFALTLGSAVGESPEIADRFESIVSFALSVFSAPESPGVVQAMQRLTSLLENPAASAGAIEAAIAEALGARDGAISAAFQPSDRAAQIEAIGLGLNVVVGLLAKDDPQAARRLQGVVRVGVAVANAYVAASSGAQAGSALGPYGAVIGAVIGLAMSWNDDSGPGSDPTLAAIAQLSRELRDLRRVMNERFDRIERILDRVYRDIMDEFTRVHVSLDEIEAIVRSIREISRRIELDLWQIARALVELDVLREDCLADLERGGSEVLFLRDLLECLQDYLRNALVVSRSPILTGADRDAVEAAREFEQASDGNARHYEYFIGVFQNHLRERAGVRGDSAPNPRFWADQSKKFLTVGLMAEDNNDVNVASGDSFNATAVGSLESSSYWISDFLAAVREHPEIFVRLSEDYAATVDPVFRLAEAEHDARRGFEVRNFINTLQDALTPVRSIGACLGDTGAFQRRNFGGLIYSYQTPVDRFHAWLEQIRAEWLNGLQRLREHESDEGILEFTLDPEISDPPYPRTGFYAWYHESSDSGRATDQPALFLPESYLGEFPELDRYRQAMAYRAGSLDFRYRLIWGDLDTPAGVGPFSELIGIELKAYFRIFGEGGEPIPVLRQVWETFPLGDIRSAAAAGRCVVPQEDLTSSNFLRCVLPILWEELIGFPGTTFLVTIRMPGGEVFDQVCSRHPRRRTLQNAPNLWRESGAAAGSPRVTAAMHAKRARLREQIAMGVRLSIADPNACDVSEDCLTRLDDLVGPDWRTSFRDEIATLSFLTRGFAYFGYHRSFHESFDFLSRVTLPSDEPALADFIGEFLEADEGALAGSPEGLPSAVVDALRFVPPVSEPGPDGEVEPYGYVVEVRNLIDELRARWPSPPDPDSPRFLRGDSNDSSVVDLSDAVFTLGFLFLGGDRPGCMAAADSNGDGVVNIADTSHSLNHLFLGGSAPPGPYPDCGTSDRASDEALECEESSCP